METRRSHGSTEGSVVALALFPGDFLKGVCAVPDNFPEFLVYLALAILGAFACKIALRARADRRRHREDRAYYRKTYGSGRRA
jgi:hypothetical protein